MNFILSIIYKSITTIASLLLTAAIIFFTLTYFSKEKKINVTEKNTILTFTLEGYITEKKEHPLYSSILNIKNHDKKIILWDLLDTIKAAAEDKNIAGIILNLKNLQIGFAQIEEIHNELNLFKQKGKFVIVYAEFLFTKEHYLASVADYIFLHPGGIVILYGIASTRNHYKSLLEKINSEVFVSKIGKYKSGPEVYSRKNMSPENKEQLSLLFKKINNNLLEALQKFSNQKIDVINKLIDDLEISSPPTALKYGMISHLGGTYDIEEFIKKRLGIEKNKDLNIVNAHEYNYKKEKKKIKFAILPIEGVIVRGKSNHQNVGAESVAEAIKKIKKDKKIEGVIIRINSPGGDSIASDIIWREISDLKNTKPVVVSMSNYAASGGYYIASAADKIFAYKNTITGSIGIYFIKFEMDKFFTETLGITKDSVATNKHSHISLSPNSRLDDLEMTIIHKNIELGYESFISKVAKARGLSIAEVDRIAQGRVWSGECAVKNRLVSEIGGINETLQYLANQLNVASKDYFVEIIPHENMSPLEEYLASLSVIMRNFSYMVNLVQAKSNMRMEEHGLEL